MKKAAKQEAPEYRLYAFGNFYLSSIQQGIQAAHATVELFLKDSAGQLDTRQSHHLHDWAEFHKTMVLLNGGDCESLKQLVGILTSPDNPFPWALFREEKSALNGALTSVVIVLPERMYNSEITDPLLEQAAMGHAVLTSFERKFLEFKKGCGLAR